MHRRDALERLATKHPGSKSHRKHAKPDKRRRRNILRRRTQGAKMATLNKAILDEGAE